MEQEKVRLPNIDPLARSVLACVRAASVATLSEIIQRLPPMFADSRTGDVHARVVLLVSGGYLDVDTGGRQAVYTTSCIGQNGRFVRLVDLPGRVVRKATPEDLEHMRMLIDSVRLFHPQKVAA